MKKILLVSVLFIPLMLITTPIAYANEPPPCLNGYALVGPPVVGTLVIDYKGEISTYNTLSFDFKGCCADCFGRCNSSCNIRIYFEKPIYNTLPCDIGIDDLQFYNVVGHGPKNCLSKEGGEDLVITNILKYECKDIDGDGKDEVIADIVMFYYNCL